MKFPIKSVLLVSLVFSVSVLSAAQTKIKWHGHAAFEIETPEGAVLLIDPWISNPKNPALKGGGNAADIVPKADYILITHGHQDHVGEAVEIAKKTGARLVANPELANNMKSILGYPEGQMDYNTIMNMGGEITIADGEVTVLMTPAVHSSGLNNPFAKDQEPTRAYGGDPVGFVLAIRNGPTLYHSGDTAYFSDMKLIPKPYSIDVALLNFGGHFGMEPPMAARAGKAVKAGLVVPHHYGTFPILTTDTNEIKNALRKQKLNFKLAEPGETLKFQGRNLIKN